MALVEEHVRFRFELVLRKIPDLVPLVLLQLHLLFYEFALRVYLVEIAKASLVRVQVNTIQVILDIVHVPFLTYAPLATYL